MSTTAGIGLTMPDGTIKAVYLHWDGYIGNGGAGETLAKYYTEPRKVERLVNLGFLSSLGAKVEPDPKTPHSWAKPQENVTVAYHRDRGQRLIPARQFKDREEYEAEGAGSLSASYLYLFEKGRWLVCRPCGGQWKWKELNDAANEKQD